MTKITKLETKKIERKNMKGKTKRHVPGAVTLAGHVK